MTKSQIELRPHKVGAGFHRAMVGATARQESSRNVLAKMLITSVWAAFAITGLGPNTRNAIRELPEFIGAAVAPTAPMISPAPARNVASLKPRLGQNAPKSP